MPQQAKDYRMMRDGRPYPDGSPIRVTAATADTVDAAVQKIRFILDTGNVDRKDLQFIENGGWVWAV